MSKYYASCFSFAWWKLAHKKRRKKTSFEKCKQNSFIKNDESSEMAGSNKRYNGLQLFAKQQACWK